MANDQDSVDPSTKLAEPKDVVYWKAWRELSDRVYGLEGEVGKIKTAFPRNDLGEPGYDAHRADHIEQHKAADQLLDYKRAGVKDIVRMVLVALGVLFSMGVMAWFSRH